LSNETTNDVLTALYQKDLPKTALRLLILFYVKSTGQAKRLTPPLSIADLAKTLGVEPRTIKGAIADLKEKNLIASKGRGRTPRRYLVDIKNENAKAQTYKISSSAMRRRIPKIAKW